MDTGDREARADEFADALERLNRTGGALLVVGRTPETVHRQSCERMLGCTSQQRVLLRTDENCSVARQEGDRVVDFPVTARCTTTAETAGDSSPGPTDGTGLDGGHESTVVESVPAFGAAAAEAIDAASTADPSGPRVCVDSALPLVESAGLQRAFECCHGIAADVRETGGVCHIHVPVARGEEPVTTFAGLADATVELRLHGERPEQRWHIHDPEVSSTWLPVTDG